MAVMLPILMDLSVIFFDLLIFTRMITLKKDTVYLRCLMYAGCGGILLLYFLATYFWQVPASAASMLCMGLPSLVLFFCLSNYKDARFFLTFCFVDTISLTVAFAGRYIGTLTGNGGTVAALCMVLVLMLGLYLGGRPYYKQYRKLLECMETGWGSMMVCAVLIYVTLIFMAVFPKPLVERIEYGPVYLLFCAVAVSCYTVFISSVRKTNRIYEQSVQLQEEKEYHLMAYTDSLTGVSNRAAYVKKLNDLERSRKPEDPICIILLDLDDFKRVNDTLGHQMGDLVLQEAARLFCAAFVEDYYSIFRYGGDEFLIIGENVTQTQVREKLKAAENSVCESELYGRVPFSFSAGLAFVQEEARDTLEKTFFRADRKMYEVKKKKKEGSE